MILATTCVAKQKFLKRAKTQQFRAKKHRKTEKMLIMCHNVAMVHEVKWAKILKYIKY